MNDRKDRIRVQIDGKEYSIEGGQFQAMLAAVKQINGRRFVSALKVWQLPGPVADVQNQLEISGFQLTGGDPVAESSDMSAPPAAPKSAAAPAGTANRSGGDRIQLTIQGQPVTLVGGAFQEMLSAVKNLPNRRFDNLSRSWEIADDLAIVKARLEEAGFRLEEAGSGPVAAAPPAMQPPRFAPTSEPPPFETPDFFDSGDIPAYEPPDWWDDDQAPPPPMSPPDWPDDELPGLPPPTAPAPTTAVGRGGDQVRIRIGGIPFLVSGGSFRDMLTVIKELPNRRFDSTDKIWDIPAETTIEVVRQRVEAAGFTLQR